MKILFVCSRNRRRSLTAEHHFRATPGLDVRSAGTSDAARVRVTAPMLAWADLIAVMEKRHRAQLDARFGDLVDPSRVAVLYITDDYEYGDPALIARLEATLAPILARGEPEAPPLDPSEGV
ncbi:MAG: protein tyrosine phosphatase [Myxococcales bacterium]|nr:protein tyrosine phosphatase [Myxococcales bacterium]